VTVFLPARIKRAVARVPLPSRRCSNNATALSKGKRDSSKIVPLRSEKWALHARQKTMRMRWPLPLQPRKERFPFPRSLWSEQFLF